MGWRVREIVRALFRESLVVKEAFLDSSLEQVLQACEMTLGTFRGGGRLLIFGNGGSAADAQHLAAEFVNRFSREREALPALALTTDTSILTSVSNDRAFAEVFARQIEALGRPGDLVYALSTSGESPNVLRGVEVARARAMHSVGFTGGLGGRLKELVDLALVVPSASAARVQEVHITIGHAICEVVDRFWSDGDLGAT
ncbi:MAG: SIS domain-containing protein [Candidatus Methylomirabilales bacterium]